MAADYLVSSLQPLALDAPAPYDLPRFLALCRDQLGAAKASAIAAAVGCGSEVDTGWTVARAWHDLDTQLRNAIAAERARARNEDPAKWRRPATGCSVYWAARVTAAFQEKEPAKRDRVLDQVRWDAAGELTPAAAPLSDAAVFTYAIRLAIVLKRRAISSDAGNATFDSLTAASRIEV